MRVLLAGNPNVGKSVVFNRLTGAYVIASNYPGTTVEFTMGTMILPAGPNPQEGATAPHQGPERADVIDVPGTYSLDPTCRAEEVAIRMLDESADDDIVLNVVDSTNLERSLGLTLQLAKRRKRMAVALNMWDERKHAGIEIDLPALEATLGVPCMPTIAVTGVGIKALVERLPEAKASALEFEDAERWHEVGRIVEKTQKVTHRHHTFLEKLRDASIRPFTGFLLAAAVMFASFEVIRFVGEGLIGYVLEPLFERLWAPVMMKLSALLGGGGFVHDILVGRLVEGRIDFGETFGVLTTGLYVPLAAVLPYVFAFYLVLSFLEDFGYLPRLAILLDNVMHGLGLHGMGVIPMLLGLGCNVPGALSARIMESRRERFIAATLMAICVPCMAQIAMIVGLAGEFGAGALVPIFLTLFVSWLVLGRVLNFALKGESPEILIDIPPYRMPYMRGLAKKVWMRLFWFVKEAVPWVLVGVLLVNILYFLRVIDLLGWLASPVVEKMLGLPREAVGGLVVGFLRKDVAIGMLEPLHLTLRQTVVASVVLAMYFPCMATFAVMAKELGARDMLKSVGIMVLAALTAGGGLNLILWAIVG